MKSLLIALVLFTIAAGTSRATQIIDLTSCDGTTLGSCQVGPITITYSNQGSTNPNDIAYIDGGAIFGSNYGQLQFSFVPPVAYLSFDFQVIPPSPLPDGATVLGLPTDNTSTGVEGTVNFPDLSTSVVDVLANGEGTFQFVYQGQAFSSIGLFFYPVAFDTNGNSTATGSPVHAGQYLFQVSNIVYDENGVPEPATTVLLGGGLLGMALAMLKRKSATR